MKKIAKVMLLFDKSVIIVDDNVSDFLVVEANPILLINVIKYYQVFTHYFKLCCLALYLLLKVLF